MGRGKDAPVIARRTPLRRSSKPIARGKRPRARRPGKPRRGPANIPAEEWRNPAYLQFLREEGRCVACLAEDFREVLLSNFGQFSRKFSRAPRGVCDPMHGPPNGTSQKGPDSCAIPGCREHHEEQTRIGWPAFEEKYHFSRELEARAYFAAFTLLQGEL